MSEAAAALGVGHTFTHDGQTYTVNALSLEGLAKFCTWMEEQAYAGVMRSRQWLPPDVYAERLDAVARDVAAQQYTVGSPLVAKAMRTLNGVKKIMEFSITPPVGPEFVDVLAAERMAEIQAILKGLNDPKAEAATTGNRQHRRAAKARKRSATSAASSAASRGATSRGKSAS